MSSNNNGIVCSTGSQINRMLNFRLKLHTRSRFHVHLWPIYGTPNGLGYSDRTKCKTHVGIISLKVQTSCSLSLDNACCFLRIYTGCCHVPRVSSNFQNFLYLSFLIKLFPGRTFCPFPSQACLFCVIHGLHKHI